LTISNAAAIRLASMSAGICAKLTCARRTAIQFATELRVSGHFVKGKTIKKIARDLGVSRNTVRNQG
jgi:DNA-binding NarL/FixJ family response regulator